MIWQVGSHLMNEKGLIPVDLVIKNARIYFNQQVVEGEIAIEGNKIAQVGKSSKMPSADKIIDAKNNLVIPGAIDIHAHLRDLDFKTKEDFYTGTSAAANGGITTVIDMPNTNPPTISKDLLERKMEKAQKDILVNVGFYAGIPNKLEDMNSFKNSGIFGFKLFLAKSLSNFDIDSQEALQNLLHQIQKMNIPILVHAERKEDIEKIIRDLKGTKVSPQELYLKSHSDRVEEHAIEYFLGLNEPIGAQIHVCHVSTSSGVEIIRRSKKLGKNITVEVTPHHLLLSVHDLKKFGTFAKMLPPLRTSDHLDTLWKGLNDEIIDMIATDHAPHMLSEKECDFSRAANGIPGFETFLPLLFTAMHSGRISLQKLIKLVSENPAKFLKTSSKGKIAVGFDADLTIIDLKGQQEIDASEFHSKAKFSPFNGRKVKGIPIMTIVNGKIIMNEGNIVASKGAGNIIRRLD